MQCHEIEEWMSVSIDGCLEPERETLLREHLAGCEKCRQDFAALERTVSMVRHLEPLSPPADLAEKVRAGIEPGQGRVISWLIFNRPQIRIALAAGLVAAVCIYGLREMARDTSSAHERAAPAVESLKSRAALQELQEDAVETAAIETAEKRPSEVTMPASPAPPSPGKASTAPPQPAAEPSDAPQAGVIWSERTPARAVTGLSAGGEARPAQGVPAELEMAVRQANGPDAESMAREETTRPARQGRDDGAAKVVAAKRDIGSDLNFALEESPADAAARAEQIGTGDRLTRLTVYGITEDVFLAALRDVLEQSQGERYRKGRIAAEQSAAHMKSAVGDTDRKEAEVSDRTSAAMPETVPVRTLFVRIPPEAFARLITRLEGIEGVRFETAPGTGGTTAESRVEDGAYLLEITLIPAK